MIHIHVVITAVILLVAAFAALIICLCVDIIPVIKSRASTLASRDSVTKEQTRKLKKSLKRGKKGMLQVDDCENSTLNMVNHQVEINEVEQNLLTKAKGNVTSMKTALATRKLSDNTVATTVRVELANSSASDNKQLDDILIPNEDKPSQQSSSNDSFIKQQDSNGNRKHKRTASEGEYFIKREYQNNTISPVVVSVQEEQNGTKEACFIFNPENTIQKKTRSPMSVGLSKKVFEYTPCLSAPTSPDVAIVRKKLPMVSKSRTYNDIIGGTQTIVPKLNFSDTTNRKHSESSLDRYQNFAWDSIHNNQSIPKRGNTHCKVCYINHLEHKQKLMEVDVKQSNDKSSIRHGMFNSETHDKIYQEISASRPAAHTHLQQQENTCLACHKLSSQIYSKKVCNMCVKTSIHDIPITTTSLHGNEQSSSPHSSSSTSPSSLSSVSYSGPRNHRKRLEDIKEDNSDLENDFANERKLEVN